MQEIIDLMLSILGKTIQAIALVWTLLSELRTHFHGPWHTDTEWQFPCLEQTPFFDGQPIIQQAVIVCPVTLVKVSSLVSAYADKSWTCPLSSSTRTGKRNSINGSAKTGSAYSPLRANKA